MESEFSPFAQSSKGAIGLMQIRYSVWKEEPELLNNKVHNKNALFWVDRNIKSGTDIFRKYYDEAKCDLRRTLYRYNSGSPKLPMGTGKWDIRYVNKVIYHAYKVRTYLAEDNKCEATATSEAVEEIVEGE